MEFYYTPQEQRESMEIKEALVNIEANIWACIYRAINRTKNIEYSESTHKTSQDPYSTPTGYETPGRTDSGGTQLSLDSTNDTCIASLIFDPNIYRSVGPVALEQRDSGKIFNYFRFIII